MRIRPMAGVRLIHRFPDAHRVLWITRRWRQTVEWVDRPETGSCGAQITCSACGEQVGFRLYSQEATRARRRKKLYGGLVTFLGFSVVMTVIGVSVDKQPWDAATYLSVLAVGFVLATPWPYFALKEAGMVIDSERKNGPHSFTLPDALNTLDEPVPYGLPPRTTIVFDDDLFDDEDGTSRADHVEG